ncbi:MAG: hypothetical protein AAF191_17855, partial [Verrucomicrobiota bacterium]
QLLMEAYHHNVKVNVEPSYHTAMKDLQTKYVAALESAQKTAQNGGRLAKAVAFRSEIERVQSGTSPSEDQNEVPAQLKSLQSVYERSRMGIENERTLRKAPFDRELLVQLDSLTETLTIAGRLEDAVFVKQKRDEFGGVNAVAGAIQQEEEEDESLQAWLQEQELYWPATNANEIALQFEGNHVLVFADGRQIMKERFKVASETEFSFPWFGTTNTFTFERGLRSFVRVFPEGRLEGKVRRASS